MRKPGEMLAHLHDLRLLVAAIQLHVDDVVGTPDVMDGGRYELRDRVDLLADVLRLLITLQGKQQGAAMEVDLRAVALLAHGRHPGAVVGECRSAVSVLLQPEPVLELVDLAVVWAIGERGRCSIEARGQPATLVISATGTRTKRDEGAAMELEQAMMSMAAGCQLECSLHREQRIAVLQFREGPDA